MSIEKFYDSYDYRRVQRRHGRAAVKAGRAAMAEIETDTTPYFPLETGHVVAIQRRLHSISNTNILCLLVNIAEPADETNGMLYAQVDEDADYQLIQYRTQVGLRPKDPSEDEQVVSAFQAIQSAMTQTVSSVK